MIFLAKAFMVCVLTMLAAYSLRHLIFSFSRLFGSQRPRIPDTDSRDLPRLSVLVPMHNEERVAAQILEALTRSEYPVDRLEIIPIDDHSTDATGRMLREIAIRDPRIRPVHLRDGVRGKPRALNAGAARARGEILAVFDADYLPGPRTLRLLMGPFVDPIVGAVMGRVIPHNVGTNVLTRLLDLERSAGYQVDQETRYNLGLIPQYGGTVGAFRKEVLTAVGGFAPDVLAEDTDLTMRLTLAGWRVAYCNHAECYEEVPETWEVRSAQLRRWAIGHTQCLYRHLPALFTAPGLRLRERLDGAMLLGTYMVAPLFLLAMLDALFLFFLGQINWSAAFLVFAGVIAHNTVGNTATSVQIGSAVLLDGSGARLQLLPLNLLNFAFSIITAARGVLAHAWSVLAGHRQVGWDKTVRAGRGPGA